jgi:hypothetical protein
MQKYSLSVYFIMLSCNSILAMEKSRLQDERKEYPSRCGNLLKKVYAYYAWIVKQDAQKPPTLNQKSKPAILSVSSAPLPLPESESMTQRKKADPVALDSQKTVKGSTHDRQETSELKEKQHHPAPTNLLTTGNRQIQPTAEPILEKQVSHETGEQEKKDDDKSLPDKNAGSPGLLPGECPIDTLNDDCIQAIAARLIRVQTLENAIKNLLAWRLVSKRFHRLQITEKLAQRFDASKGTKIPRSREQTQALCHFAAHCFFRGTPSERRQFWGIFQALNICGVPVDDVVSITDRGAHLPGTVQQALLQFPFSHDPKLKYNPEWYGHISYINRLSFLLSLSEPTSLEHAELKTIANILDDRINKLPPQKQLKVRGLLNGAFTLPQLSYGGLVRVLDQYVTTGLAVDSVELLKKINEQDISADEKELFTAVLTQPDEVVSEMLVTKAYSHTARNCASLLAHFHKKESLALALFTVLEESERWEPKMVRVFPEFVRYYLALSVEHSQIFGTAVPLRLYQYILESSALPITQTDYVIFNADLDRAGDSITHPLFMTHELIIPLLYSPDKSDLFRELMKLLRTHKSVIAKEIATFIECCYNGTADPLQKLDKLWLSAHYTSKDWTAFLTQVSCAFKLGARRGTIGTILKEWAGALPYTFLDMLAVQALQYRQPKSLIYGILEAKNTGSRLINGREERTYVDYLV